MQNFDLTFLRPGSNGKWWDQLLKQRAWLEPIKQNLQALETIIQIMFKYVLFFSNFVINEYQLQEWLCSIPRVYKLKQLQEWLLPSKSLKLR